MIKKLIDLNRFFYLESYRFISPFTMSDILYYPIAYCKFMYYSIKEIINQKNASNQ